MHGSVAFLPFDPAFLRDVVVPLWDGESIDPTAFQDRCWSHYAAAYRCETWKQALAEFLRPVEAHEPETGSAARDRVRVLRRGLERMFTPVDREAERLRAEIDEALVLRGRPFLVTEGSVDSVAARVDEYLAAANDDAIDALAREQLVRQDPELARRIVPADGPPAASPLSYRAAVLRGLKSVHALGKAVRDQGRWRGELTEGLEAAEAATRLPWFAAVLHARRTPFWYAEHADGLAAVSDAAGVPMPECASTAATLFADLEPCVPRPTALGPVEDRSLGVWVPPERVPDLVDWLNGYGARILRAASEFGETDAVRSVLRKMKECATFAIRHGAGYLEAGGIEPPHRHDPLAL